MELQYAMLSRRSARKFKHAPVPEQIINEMLKMAQVAPSGGDGQTHVFGIIREDATKRALADAAGGQLWIADAPLVIACCARLPEDFNALPEDDFGFVVNKLRWGKPLMKYIMAYPDWNGMASLFADSAPLIPTEHMCLTAVSYGLACCIIGWLDVQRASEILKLPDDIRCLYLLAVGYPDEEPEPKELKSIDEISFYEEYKA